MDFITSLPTPNKSWALYCSSRTKPNSKWSFGSLGFCLMAHDMLTAALCKKSTGELPMSNFFIWPELKMKGLIQVITDACIIPDDNILKSGYLPGISLFNIMKNLYFTVGFQHSLSSFGNIGRWHKLRATYFNIVGQFGFVECETIM